MKKIPCTSKNGKVFFRIATNQEKAAFERQEKIVELREGGLTFAEIGKKYGFSPARAHQLYIKGKREYL